MGKTANANSDSFTCIIPRGSDKVEDFLRLKDILTKIRFTTYSSDMTMDCQFSEENVADRLHLLRLEIATTSGMEGKEYVFSANNICKINMIQGGSKYFYERVTWIEGILRISDHLLEKGLIHEPIVCAFLIPAL